MDNTIVDSTLLRVREQLKQDNIRGALDLIEALYPPDQADLFDELDPEQQRSLLPQLEAEDAADILEELGDEEAAELAAQIGLADLASIVEEMAPDEAADLLGDLDPSFSTEMLALLSDSDEVEPLLLHPDETAGGLMTSEYVVFPQTMRAGQVLVALRNWRPQNEDAYHVFVVDEQERLVGMVGLLPVIRANPQDVLSDIMSLDVLKVHVQDDQESAARLMARYDLVAVPVVDEDDHLVGIITVDDLVDVLEHEATEDIQRISGSEPLLRPYLDSPVLSMAWKRLGWLLLLFVTGTLTGTVMRQFEGILAQVVTLSVFVPLLIGTGGNAGSQTTATVIRALGVGDIELNDALKVFWQELRASLILGVLLSIVAFVRAATWGNGMRMSIVVSVSILAIVIWAECVGAMLPLLAAKLRLDPALVSGPLMSTLVDATGLLIYFSIAQAVL